MLSHDLGTDARKPTRAMAEGPGGLARGCEPRLAVGQKPKHAPVSTRRRSAQRRDAGPPSCAVSTRPFYPVRSLRGPRDTRGLCHERGSLPEKVMAELTSDRVCEHVLPGSCCPDPPTSPTSAQQRCPTFWLPWATQTDTDDSRGAAQSSVHHFRPVWHWAAFKALPGHTRESFVSPTRAPEETERSVSGVWTRTHTGHP